MQSKNVSYKKKTDLSLSAALSFQLSHTHGTGARLVACPLCMQWS